jgi:hypothetical protein
LCAHPGMTTLSKSADTLSNDSPLCGGRARVFTRQGTNHHVRTDGDQILTGTNGSFRLRSTSLPTSPGCTEDLTSLSGKVEKYSHILSTASWPAFLKLFDGTTRGQRIALDSSKSRAETRLSRSMILILGLDCGSNSDLALGMMMIGMGIGPSKVSRRRSLVMGSLCRQYRRSMSSSCVDRAPLMKKKSTLNVPIYGI